MSGLYKDIATGETIKRLAVQAEDCQWLEKLPSYDGSVGSNGTINFAELGVAPEVLINNTAYPLGISSRADTNKAISLDHLQTQVTKITENELKGLVYDKQSSVLDDHASRIFETKIEKALHSLAPTSNTTDTPVISVTGQVNVDDLIALKRKFDDLKIPKTGRILVLSSQHVSDLLEQDSAFAQRYNNTETGRIANQYGFDIYESPLTPAYSSSGSKKTFGAEAADGDLVSSIAFYAPYCMRAQGDTKVYITEPTAEYQDWRYAVSDYFVAMPKTAKALGAIISAIE